MWGGGGGGWGVNALPKFESSYMYDLTFHLIVCDSNTVS